MELSESGSRERGWGARRWCSWADLLADVETSPGAALRQISAARTAPDAVGAYGESGGGGMWSGRFRKLRRRR